MNEKVSSILTHLKQNNISAQRIEKDLGFSNGVLGKAAKGLGNLSEPRLTQLEAYYQSKLAELGLAKQPPKEPENEQNEDNGKQENNNNDTPPPPSFNKYDFLNS